MPVLLTEEASDDLANASARHPEFRGDGRGVLAELALTDDRGFRSLRALVETFMASPKNVVGVTARQ